LVMSTGVIGAPLEVDKIEGGIHQAAEDLSEEAGARAASAIMTTDTRPKHRAVRVEGEWGSYALGGIAKGAGMI
ncbi:MAG: bifunctional ornithine acetyltransferase/N-acetylglutamate synthase, partial [Gammaproteobacteria bacterium]|nr:bifunctional ornithine acetyltransferase/N-acetylglutamate synthase [Gammaproteobacteria bacterium]NIT63553.1 bifunctional ornithine acetyltransferase/N-acetylglutamate synthase [Gammaproteobacteria bacterium]NIV20353.1 ornithine acetyltransferase [Gammaproteobacteria bacterium]NIY32133.1 ornithine acetyltransferase [Gammaproteobacteria bacterium]